MMRGKKKYYLPAIVWAVLITIVSSIPNLSTPRLGITFVDKLAHFLEYAVLGFLTARAVRGFRDDPWSIFWISSAIAALFGVLDETHQLFVPGRSMEFLDMTADILGSVLASAIYVRYFQKRLVSRS